MFGITPVSYTHLDVYKRQAYGQQCTADLLDSLSEHPPIYVRLNNTKGDEEYLLRRLMEENVKAEAITWVPDVYKRQL